MAAAGPAIPIHLELAVQSMKVPREPILIMKAKKNSALQVAKKKSAYSPLRECKQW